MKEYKLRTVFYVFYRYLTAKPQKTVLILMLLEGAIFIQLIKNFMERPKILFVTKFYLFVYRHSGLISRNIAEMCSIPKVNRHILRTGDI